MLPRFRAANTQVLGVSIDSVYSHANWGASLGGVSFPLLSDFQPKGGMAKDYGAYLDGPGITDRATIIIDKDGVVRHATSAGPGGQRDISELAGFCEKVNGEFGQGLSAAATPAGLSAGAQLFIKSACGPSRAALLVRDNLHLAGSLAVKNVSEDASAKAELTKLAGKDQSPALVCNGEVMHESADITNFLVSKAGNL